jgi:hypothetical protein
MLRIAPFTLVIPFAFGVSVAARADENDYTTRLSTHDLSNSIVERPDLLNHNVRGWRRTVDVTDTAGTRWVENHIRADNLGMGFTEATFVLRSKVFRDGTSTHDVTVRDNVLSHPEAHIRSNVVRNEAGRAVLRERTTHWGSWVPGANTVMKVDPTHRQRVREGLGRYERQGPFTGRSGAGSAPARRAPR